MLRCTQHLTRACEEMLKHESPVFFTYELTWQILYTHIRCSPVGVCSRTGSSSRVCLRFYGKRWHWWGGKRKEKEKRKRKFFGNRVGALLHELPSFLYKHHYLGIYRLFLFSLFMFTAVITMDKALLWTDARYFLQVTRLEMDLIIPFLSACIFFDC